MSWPASAAGLAGLRDGCRFEGTIEGVSHVQIERKQGRGSWPIARALELASRASHAGLGVLQSAKRALTA
ncbi:MAG: hypothetical protein ABIT16_09845 [Croceibacterium sp.]